MPAIEDLKPLPKRHYPAEVIPVYQKEPPQLDAKHHEQGLLTTGADILTDFIPGVSNLKDATIALSGIISDQTEETNTQLRSFGLNLGRAFQIQDDILEVYGDVETVGKSLGSDLISGKQTILTVLAREDNQEEWLSSWKNIKKMETQTAILRLRDYLNRKNIIDKAYKYVEEYVGKARDKLDVIPLNHRDKLKQFTNIILKRVK